MRLVTSANCSSWKELICAFSSVALEQSPCVDSIQQIWLFRTTAVLLNTIFGSFSLRFSDKVSLLFLLKLKLLENPWWPIADTWDDDLPIETWIRGVFCWWMWGLV